MLTLEIFYVSCYLKKCIATGWFGGTNQNFFSTNNISCTCEKKLFQLHFARLSNKLIDVQNTPSAYWLTLKSCNQSQKDTMHSFSALPENKLEKTEIILWWC